MAPREMLYREREERCKVGRVVSLSKTLNLNPFPDRGKWDKGPA